MSIQNNIENLLNEIPEGVCLVAVSKTKPAEDILEAYECGQRIFGENKVQELVSKYEILPKDIIWHFIGHLQTNKIKYIAAFVDLIHSVDSLKLLVKINAEAKKNNRIIKCLLEFHIAQEDTKFGLSFAEAKEIISTDEFKALKNISIAGVMGMPTYTGNSLQLKREFGLLKSYFDELKKDFFYDQADFKEISMGMSGDYLIAIEEGSTMVRIGSNIFGAR